MGQVAQYPMQGLQPSRLRDRAARGGVALPWGGPTQGSVYSTDGNNYAAGLALTLVGGTAQPEIWTLTPSGSGTWVLQFGTGDGIKVSTAVATGTGTAAQVLAALQAIWPAWALPAGSVTGSAGGPYTVTFGVNARIGGNVNFVTTGSAAVALVRSQRGSVGSGQYDVTDGSTYTAVDAILVDSIGTNQTGDLNTVPYGSVTDTTFSPWAWIEGFFFTTDNAAAPALVIPNLTNAIVATSPKLTFYIGSSVTAAGTEVRLLQ